MDFKKSLTEGLEAAKKARDNKKEILALISDVSKIIEDFSEGKVSLKITNERRLAKGATQLSAGLAAVLGETAYVDYKALSLTRNPQGTPKKILADWEIDQSDGYPCIISYNKQDITCHNKETLQQALSELLSDASTGEKLLRLMESKEGS
ncbi:TPA: hypothetical protein ACNH3N_004029 [Klebsiella variicola]